MVVSIEQRAREMADQIFTDEPVIVDEEPDLQSMFARLLWKEDWTDKVSNGFGRLFHHSTETIDLEDDDQFPEELADLIPDMEEVKKAYGEMTNDYLDFIRVIWDAQQLRKQQQQQQQQMTQSSDEH
jgi:hypothetical protein